jgi:hypothetical protein
MALTDLRQERMATLAEWLEANDAHEGLEMSWAEVADELDWPSYQVHDAVRDLKEHPDVLGVGLTVKRGPKPRIVLSTGAQRIDDRVVYEVELMTRHGVVEAIKRLARYVATDSSHTANALNKRAGAHRRHVNGYNHRRAMLVNMQAELDATVPEEADAIEFIEALLQRM